MRITQFCQLYPPAIYGGGEFLFFNYAKELVRLGHEVNVVTQMLKGAERFEVLDGVNIHRSGRPISYEGHLTMSFTDNVSYILKSFRDGLRVAKNSDVIHSNAYSPAISGHLTSFFRKAPHVISFFDVYTTSSGFWKDWSGQKSVSRSLGFIGPLMERVILKFRPAAIHTISHTSELDLLKARVRAPVRVVPAAINLDDYKKPRVKVKEQFCFVGRHVFYKNVDTVIKAMPSIVSKRTDTKFIVVGDGPMRREWEGLSKKLGVDKNVLFTGRVSHEHKLKIISESKLVVNPSMVEGFGIVLLEAWALNKPVIVSDVGPLNELVNNSNGAVVSPFKENEWAETIINVMSKGRKGLRKHAEKYSIRKVAPLLLDLFRAVV
jgi:glycosyltransferase involved in cell wall biosynthesis